MAADAHPYPIREGSQSVIYGRATADSGTLTIQAGGTYTLYDKTGAIVTGHSAQAVTGYDSTAAAAPRVWKNLDFAAIASGEYHITFKFTALGSDGMTRTYEPSVFLLVKEAYQ